MVHLNLSPEQPYKISTVIILKNKGPRLKEVQYLNYSLASIAGAESRQSESRTNALKDSAETFQIQEYQQRNTRVHLQMALVKIALTKMLSSTYNYDIQNLHDSKKLQWQ